MKNNDEGEQGGGWKMEKVWKIEAWKIRRGTLKRVGSCWNGRWR
jgi:hypothetical protein